MPYGQPKVNEKGKESLRELPHEIIDFDTGQYEAGRTKKTLDSLLAMANLVSSTVHIVRLHPLLVT